MTPARRLDFMAATGPTLLARGYDLTSIVHGLKHPGRRGWAADTVGLRHDLARDARGDSSSAEQVAQWAADPRITGVGVICNNVHAIDVDVWDARVAAEFADMVEARLGASVRRIGRAPKVLLVYRCASPLRRSRSARYRDPTAPVVELGRERLHGVDFWGEGSQFVAYGWHPDTGRPYYYEGRELADVDRADLPPITDADVAWLRDAFDRVARGAGWEVVDVAAERGEAERATTRHVGSDAFLEAAAPKYGASLDDVRGMLDQIDPDLDGADYDAVVKAVAFEFDGDEAAFTLLRDWASRGAKWTDKGSGLKQLRTRWTRAKHPPAGVAPVRLATLRDWITKGRNARPGAAPVDDDPFALSTPPEDPAAGFDAVNTPPKPRAFYIEDEAEFASEFTPPDWLVADYFVRGETSTLFGDPGTYKSFLALDVAYHVASGRAWHGHDVAQGAVVYVAGEGRRGLRSRSAAWRQYYQIEGRVPLGFTSGPVTLNDRTSLVVAVRELDAFRDRLGPIALIVVDTLARNNTADENSNTDMGLIMANVGALQARYGCAVLLLHHVGTQNKNRARGASALHGAMDSQYRLDREGDALVKMVCTKMKDAPEPRDKWFAGTVVEHGEASSLVFEETEARSGPTGEDPTSPRYGLRGLQLAVYDLVAAEQPVDRDVLRAIVADDPAPHWDADPAKRLRQLRTAVWHLVQKGALVETANDRLTTADYAADVAGFDQAPF